MLRALGTDFFTACHRFACRHDGHLIFLGRQFFARRFGVEFTWHSKPTPNWAVVSTFVGQSFFISKYMSYCKSAIVAFSFLFILLLASPTRVGLSKSSQGEVPSSGTNHALIIGINNYKHMENLKSPVKDAEQIEKILTKKYNFRKSNISLLTDNTKDKPTLVNILTSLERYASSLTSNDNLLIFFSGHGKEDDDGETYWIPRDGKKNSKLTWLKHSDLCDELFASEDMKAKNLCIITDSPFSNKLLRSSSISLTPYDLRYFEKIIERASRTSREVISFGDQHWPGSKRTNGLGLFTYYIHRALTENALEIIDLENLIFDENILFSITKIAGTRMSRGRLRTPVEKGGQFIIAKIAPSPVVHILETSVRPQRGYTGELFTVEAKTSGPASDVYLEIDGRKLRMEGTGADWKYNIKIDRLGDTPYRLTAINANDVQGKAQSGKITTVKRRATPVNVNVAAVNPKKGLGGDQYHFTATTDAPADLVSLLLKNKRYKMDGSGTQWYLSKKIDDIGTVDFSVIAVNADGVEGRPKGGKVLLEAGISNVAEIQAIPKTGYAGEEFVISVKTDRVAETVSIKVDGKEYAMKGSGNTWRYKMMIPDIGTKRFTAVARNINGDTGLSKSGEILTQKSPLAIPDVASIQVSVVSPGKGYAGDKFKINVKTSAPSNKVYIDIEGNQFPMDGSGTQWTYLARIEKIGVNKFSVMARNKDDIQGQSKEGEIITVKKPASPVNVLSASVKPLKGHTKTPFTFSASTDAPAKGVALLIGEKRYEMTGTGTQWRLSRRIDETGPIDISFVARNEDDREEGTIKTANVTVVKDRYKYNDDGTLTDLITGKTKNRFVDNGDGTVTDMVTSLMWLKQPKQIALDWDKAVTYCRNLDYKGYTGWRLPTITELRDIRDKKQQNPALPIGHPFTGVLTHIGYWSKSKHKFGPKYVYQMNLWYGKIGYQKKDGIAIVWPVRYAEALDEG